MNEKGTSFSIMFIYIAMVVIGSSSLIDLSRSFSFFYILKLIIDCILLGGYYLLNIAVTLTIFPKLKNMK